MTIPELRKAIDADPACLTIGGTHFVPQDIVNYWLGWAEAHNAKPTTVPAFVAWCLRMEEAVSNYVMDEMPEEWFTDGDDAEGGAA